MTGHFDLDHVGIAVCDLDVAGHAYRKLGFTLNDKSFHVAPPSPGAAPQPAGTGNHCFMLGHGYVEIIAPTDPDYKGRLLQDLDRYQGVHLIALGTKSAKDAAAMISTETGKPAGFRDLSRPFTDKGRDFLARFTIIDTPARQADEPHFFAIEHLTRDDLWQPHLMVHANGAQALKSVTLCVNDPMATAKAMALPFGASCLSDAHHASVVLSPGTLECIDLSTFFERFPGEKPLAMPSVVAIRLGVADIETTRRVLSGNGIQLHDGPQSPFVSASDACGAIIEFVQN